MGTLVRVTINDERIASLFVPGGDGWGWMRKVGTEQLYETIGRSPIRTGELASSFKLSLTPNGKYQTRYTVGTYSEHAIYVIFGTGPIIWGSGKVMSKPRKISKKKGGGMTPTYPLMRIRAAPHSWFANPVLMRFVRGQKANDFMGDAADVILARYG